MLAGLEVLVLVLGQRDLLLVVGQLQVGSVVLLDLGHLLAALPLLLASLGLLLQLLGRLLGFPRQVAGADLAAQNGGLCPVVVLDAESHLCEDELGLLPSLHGAKRLDLQLAQNFHGRLLVALLLLDVRQDAGHAGALDLDEDLAFGHGAQRLDDGELSLQVRGVVEELHDGLDHAGHGLLELAMLLGEHEHLVVEQAPFSGLLADGAYRDEDA